MQNFLVVRTGLEARGLRFLFFAKNESDQPRCFNASEAISRPTGHTGVCHSISSENQLIERFESERNYLIFPSPDCDYFKSLNLRNKIN